MLLVFGFFSTRSGIYYLNAEDKDPLQIIYNIGDLLNQTMREYKSKNYTDASELIDITYIDNYEYTEEKLKELDKNLMEKTESLIREDYSNTINNKELIENRNNLYNTIQNNLEMLVDQFRQN
ncbi:MAG: hypothetical protein R3321_02845 [Nitrososphaeraceae archaeon]|nr:hypothetical protein [Nitrososphaeraceae archaeon]